MTAMNNIYYTSHLKGNSKMKITKEELKQIIKEEIEAVMEVGGRSGGTGGFIKDKPAVKKPIDDYHAKILNLKKKYGKISNIPDDEMPASPGSGPTGRTAESMTEDNRERSNDTIQQIKQTEGWANMLPSQAWRAVSRHELRRRRTFKLE